MNFTSTAFSKTDEEMMHLQLDKRLAGKSANQMQKHSVDEQYSNKPIERCLYILTKGDDLQKISVIQSLPELLLTDNNATLTRIIPKIQQELPNSSSEFHIVASQIFKILIAEMKVPINLIRPVLQGIESKDPIVASSWVETLLSVIYCLPENLIRTDVIPFTVKMSQINQPIIYRISSCKLLGAVAVHPKLSIFDVKKDILPFAQSLCQDCLYEVRAAICAELKNIGKGLDGDPIIKTSLLPCLVELSGDESMQVRVAAVDAVVQLIPYTNADSIKQTILPLVKRLCVQSLRDGDHTYPFIAKSYGLLLRNLNTHLTSHECSWFIEFYRQLSLKGLHTDKEELEIEPTLFLQCREYCAYNLPAIVSFTMSQAPSEYKKTERIFKDLAGDPCYLVRRTVASSIHEIANILGKESKNIVSDIVKLLRDDAEDVLDALVPNIKKTLDVLSVIGLLSRDNINQPTLEMCRALLKCQLEIFKYFNWRRKTIFLQQLESLPKFIHPDFIHQHFTPCILKLTTDARARPVRTQAARTVLHFLRFSPKENHRKWIRENLITTLCHSSSCYTRHIYIKMCIEAFSLFSWKYFKDFFFMPLLGLGEDPVSTVRLSVINLYPTLKQMLILPIDRNIQIRLENFIAKIEMMEKDQDVIAALHAKLKEIRTTVVNRQELLQEEKRKIEEEERILHGQLLVPQMRSPQQASIYRPHEAARSGVPITLSRSPLASKKSEFYSTSPSDMSFLDKHFYTDAGVALPERVELTHSLLQTNKYEGNLEKLTVSAIKVDTPPDKETIPTVLEEDASIINLSDEDLRELQKSTNITDDMKVNLKKMNVSKNLDKPPDGVKRRNKRYSCILPTEQLHPKTSMNRRSLNIPNEGSKIPISFRLKKINDEKENGKVNKMTLTKSKSEDFPDKKLDGCKKRTNDIDNNISTPKPSQSNIVKENITLNSNVKSMVPNNSNNKNNSAKVSSLPVLTRKLYPRKEP